MAGECEGETGEERGAEKSWAPVERRKLSLIPNDARILAHGREYGARGSWWSNERRALNPGLIV